MKKEDGITLCDILGKSIVEKNNIILKGNEENPYSLCSALETNKATLILGAGVSIPYGIPSWEGLLVKTWGRILEVNPSVIKKDISGNGIYSAERAVLQEIQEVCKKIDRNDDYKKASNQMIEKGKSQFIKNLNLLEFAEYLKYYVDESLEEHEADSIEGKLRERIFKHILKDTMINSFKDKESGKPTTALEAIIELLENKDKVSSVITYNYDNLLEYFLDKKNIDFNIVCRETDLPTSSKQPLNIYHPHGYIHVLNKMNHKENNHDDSENLILTESSYYRLESKSYSWENSVQAKAFFDTTCIFIGFSGTDYNFRRILKNRETHNILKESGNYKKHYMLYCINDIAKKFFQKASEDSEITDEELKDRASNPTYGYEKNQFFHFLSAQYLYWSHYNLIPIWTTFKELPALIQELKG